MTNDCNANNKLFVKKWLAKQLINQLLLLCAHVEKVGTLRIHVSIGAVAVAMTMAIRF